MALFIGLSIMYFDDPSPYFFILFHSLCVAMVIYYVIFYLVFQRFFANEALCWRDYLIGFAIGEIIVSWRTGLYIEEIS